MCYITSFRPFRSPKKASESSRATRQPALRCLEFASPKLRGDPEVAPTVAEEMVAIDRWENQGHKPFLDEINMNINGTTIVTTHY